MEKQTNHSVWFQALRLIGSSTTASYSEQFSFHWIISGIIGRNGKALILLSLISSSLWLQLWLLNSLKTWTPNSDLDFVASETSLKCLALFLRGSSHFSNQCDNINIYIFCNLFYYINLNIQHNTKLMLSYQNTKMEKKCKLCVSDVKESW